MRSSSKGSDDDGQQLFHILKRKASV